MDWRKIFLAEANRFMDGYDDDYKNSAAYRYPDKTEYEIDAEEAASDGDFELAETNSKYEEFFNFIEDELDFLTDERGMHFKVDVKELNDNDCWAKYEISNAMNNYSFRINFYIPDLPRSRTPAKISMYIDSDVSDEKVRHECNIVSDCIEKIITWVEEYINVFEKDISNTEDSDEHADYMHKFDVVGMEISNVVRDKDTTTGNIKNKNGTLASFGYTKRTGSVVVNIVDDVTGAKTGAKRIGRVSSEAEAMDLLADYFEDK